MSYLHSRLAIAFFLVLLCFIAASTASATRWVINFGGHAGSPTFGYSPNTLQVSLGDTVEFHGAFSGHPLQFDAVPGNASKTGHSGSDTLFVYVVSVSGDYAYSCVFHKLSHNMVGTFSTNAASVRPEPVMTAPRTQILDMMPNPATKMTMIDFELAKAGTVRITITSMDGKLVDTPLNTTMEAGAQMIDYDCSKLAAGSYLVTLESNGVKVSKRVVVEK